MVIISVIRYDENHRLKKKRKKQKQKKQQQQRQKRRRTTDAIVKEWKLNDFVVRLSKVFSINM